MNRLVGFIGMSVGSWFGWAAGANVSLTTAAGFSLVGTGVGLFLARRIMQDQF
jgi:hypothetical protein